MPKPTEEDLKCLVKLLLNPYLKLSAQIPFALRLFARYETLQPQLTKMSQEISRNCGQMLQRIIDLVQKYVKK
jgi:hypothetical protein